MTADITNSGQIRTKLAQIALDDALFYQTEESKEGVKAFNEKRKPNFRKVQK